MKPYSYVANNAVSTLALTEWKFESHLDGETYVLPDGCRDFIVQYSAAGEATWFVSDLSQTSYSVPTITNAKICGIRLEPGVEVLQAKLSSWLHGRDPSVLFGSDQIDEFCLKNENLTDALDCLASGHRTVAYVAAELGVSLRSLQRLVAARTGRTPHFWFSLARIRRAGRLLAEDRNLSDVAIDAGFADQAHMTREMRKWFGRTPSQVKSNQDILDTIFESGYGH